MSIGTSSMREDVAGPQDRAPVLEVEREVVQLAVGALDEGEVVRGVSAGHPGADQLGVLHALDDPLGGPEVQDLHEEPLDQALGPRRG